MYTFNHDHTDTVRFESIVVDDKGTRGTVFLSEAALVLGAQHHREIREYLEDREIHATMSGPYFRHFDQWETSGPYFYQREKRSADNRYRVIHFEAFYIIDIESILDEVRFGRDLIDRFGKIELMSIGYLSDYSEIRQAQYESALRTIADGCGGLPGQHRTIWIGDLARIQAS